MPNPKRPLPVPTGTTQPFWDAARRNQLVAQRCVDCCAWRHYPQAMCPECHSDRTEWAIVGGRGVIHSYTIAHHAFDPYWKDRVPYVIATVELEEGIRMVSDMPELDVDVARIGLEVEVFFEPVNEEITLPRFRLVGKP